MELKLDEVEARILGSLLEKEMATPEYYPLSLNALVNACNQKSNRAPVVFYDEETVLRGLAGLREKQLVVASGASRVAKYEQTFTGPRKMVRREAAIICELLLRGPQTGGELRGRAERLHSFSDGAEVKKTLDDLEALGFVTLLPRQAGQKEARYAHLLSGAPEAAASPAATRPDSTGSTTGARLEKLEAEVIALRQEIAELRSLLESRAGSAD
ncbi:MAG: DUF480 domain-containing protein [Desulfobacteraceae bacterium]|nr:MAG: DUF480 domain-containing protein [Desulfobacteraceae bacterium]